MVDVLANDADPDGDALQVESVSTPAHGTASVAGNGVRYAPASNYHGTDRFTYVVSDGNGQTATASVQVAVAPVNDAPAAADAIPYQLLEEDGGAVTLALGPFFTDPDGDALTFGATSSDPSVVTPMVVGAALRLTPAAFGTATVTVTAKDPDGLSATQTFGVGVSDQNARAVVTHTLAGLARSHLASARAALGKRMTAKRAEASGLTLTVLGHRAPLGKAAARCGGTGASASTSPKRQAARWRWTRALHTGSASATTGF